MHTLPDAPWLLTALNELGESEIPGHRHNPRIIQYNQATAHAARDDETAWCASFVNWCLEQCAIEGTGSTAARSFINWGEAIEEPSPGCIVVLWRDSPSSWKGHVGFYIGPDKQNPAAFMLLGGNQGNRVSIVSYPRRQILGFRLPEQHLLQPLGTRPALAASRQT